MDYGARTELFGDMPMPKKLRPRRAPAARRKPKTTARKGAVVDEIEFKRANRQTNAVLMRSMELIGRVPEQASQSLPQIGSRTAAQDGRGEWTSAKDDQQFERLDQQDWWREVKPSRAGPRTKKKKKQRGQNLPQLGNEENFFVPKQNEQYERSENGADMDFISKINGVFEAHRR